MKILAQGAEATIEQDKDIVTKKRISKSYRLPEIDEKITKLRTRSEAKILEKAGKIIPIPKVLESNEKQKTISMDFIEGKKLSQELNNLDNQLEIMQQIGESISKLHKENIIHGDLTTSNMILKENKVYFVDFGLGFQNGKYEDKAVDIHLLKQALEAKHFQNWQELFKAFEKGYLSINTEDSEKILERLKAVEKRGRYKH